ncbi:SDR family oxidoreductase [Nocardioides panacisoli]|uniref:SDR family NAD(P)-dependent oxidoreductase n=1 Tax=Nocardioides panacisoli TaxID=627624 RepID=UPI001C63079E|nr:SDR family oxidoreductase [Nocardioides panacisoli]QYJ04678.1 SDR family oxidoreductase [Nocardioides panacisoli]
MSVALVTGGSAGLGRALVSALADRGWRVITDARDAARLAEVDHPAVRAVPGDVADPDHRGDLLAAVAAEGRLDLLVHNASTLGPTPLPELGAVTEEDLARVIATNVWAPVALTQRLLLWLEATGGILASISSDVAVEQEPGWGAYGLSKAALDHATAQFGAEHPGIAAYAVDPGDMRTAMHQAAFPGEDISDRPLPESVVPQLLALFDRRPPSGRHRAADWAAAAPGTPGEAVVR